MIWLALTPLVILLAGFVWIGLSQRRLHRTLDHLEPSEHWTEADRWWYVLTYAKYGWTPRCDPWENA